MYPLHPLQEELSDSLGYPASPWQADYRLPLWPGIFFSEQRRLFRFFGNPGPKNEFCYRVLQPAACRWKKSGGRWKNCPPPWDHTWIERRTSLAQDALYGHEPDSDMELVRRVRQGDEAAFRRVVDIHGPRLYLLAVSMLGNPEDAQDVVQETFVGAFRGLRGFQGRSTVKTWLTRILMNNVADLRRRRHLRKTLPFDEAAEQLGASPAWRVTETGRADMRMDIAAVVGRLPEEHRTVIVLREMQGMTYEEIAAALGVPRGTVESRLFRARQKLKEILGDYLT